jgi:hypothetical protein
MVDATDTARVQLRAGRLHIPREVYRALLPGCTAVALLARDGQWLLLPLLAGAGGLQIKIRNARGDRVIESQEFFRGQGLEDKPEPCDITLASATEVGGFRLTIMGDRDGLV